MGTPPSGELNTRGVRTPNIAILDLSNAISRKRCKMGAKLVLISNRKSHMGFRLVPNSMTLDDLERRNFHIRSVILPNSVAFGRITWKWLKIHQYLLQRKCRPKNLVLAIYHLWRYWQGSPPATGSESDKVRHSALVSENLTNNQPYR